MSDTAPLGETRDVDFADTRSASAICPTALSTIMARSLPDVRDGLKPMRIAASLHAMHDLRLDPASGYKKCARTSSATLIGKFHPHGDVSVYDALVRLAQDFRSATQAGPTGRANFGNIDGDNAAAMPRLHREPAVGWSTRAGRCSTRNSTRMRSISARPMTARTGSR